MTETKPKSRVHTYVVRAALLLAAALSALIWFHPTVGYAKGGAIDGADLRGGLLLILWLVTGAFVLCASLTVRLTKGRPVQVVLAYIAGIAAAIAILPLIDKFI